VKNRQQNNGRKRMKVDRFSQVKMRELFFPAKNCFFPPKIVFPAKKETGQKGDLGIP
jgi:hypothetical protein